ncbi:MAG: zinc ribbon domain-containing protein [Promethearchaeota archaeon]|nr:MAG: zinc ribbon domain-containing protein [Candidatus Lokiarchaeota archaeon]
MEIYSFEFYWSWFLEWFINLPLVGQILVVIGITTVIILSSIGLYYLLKGIGYLIYYLCKGIYFILKGIALGFYKLLIGIYHLIFGKQEANDNESDTSQEIELQKEPVPLIQKSVESIPSSISFCPECGIEFTDMARRKMNENGQVYCTYCGNKVESKSIKIDG